MNHAHHTDDRGIAAVVLQLKTELAEILHTRFQILKTELKEKLDLSKTALPLLAGALVFLFGGFAALTFALIALVHAALVDNPFSWAIGGTIVAFLYLVLGLAGLLWLKRVVRPADMIPTRTLKVLKQDQTWLEKEVA